MPETTSSLPPAAVLVRHRVADFDPWKVGFDDQQPGLLLDDAPLPCFENVTRRVALGNQLARHGCHPRAVWL